MLPGAQMLSRMRPSWDHQNASPMGSQHHMLVGHDILTLDISGQLLTQSTSVIGGRRFG